MESGIKKAVKEYDSLTAFFMYRNIIRNYK